MRISLILLFLLFSVVLMSQAPTWQWARSIEEDPALSGSSEGYSITVDVYTAASYSTGVFTGTIDCDPGPGVFNLSSTGTYDAVIYKFDSLGIFQWAKQLGGTSISEVYAEDIGYDPGGFVYIAGQFHGTVDFNPDTSVLNITSTGVTDAYLLKLDQNGNFIWVKTWGDMNAYTAANSIAINYSTDYVYCSGNFSGQVDFNPGAGVFNLGSGDSDVFISVFDGNGNFITAGQIGGFAEAYMNDLEYDQQHQQLFVTGEYYLLVDFDPLSTVHYLTSEGDFDLFVLCLDSDLSFNWVFSGGTDYAYCDAYTVAYNVAGNGSIYVSGSVSEPFDIDPGSGVTILPGGNYILKLTRDGEFQWAIPYSNIIGVLVAAEKNGNGGVIALSHFIYTVDADPGPEIYLLTSGGGTDFFVSRLDSNGIFSWAKQALGDGDDLGEAMVLTPNNDVVITGGFGSTQLTFDATTLLNPEDWNTLLVKLGNTCPSIVQNTNDAGFGSLRDVIGCVTTGAMISFDLPPNSQITLTSGEIVINKNITLLGSGMYDLTLSGNTASRIFHLVPGKVLGLENLALKNGSQATHGGAIWAEGNLSLKNILFENNYENVIPKSMSLSPGIVVNMIQNVHIGF